MSEDKQPRRKKQKLGKYFSRPRIRVVLVTVLAATVLLGIVWRVHRMLVYNSHFLAANSDPVQYVTGNLINALIILAVLMQVVIYFRMASQNERLIKASEKSNAVAQEAFHAGEAPYFGIPQITLTDFPSIGKWPQAKIVLLNGGKTPAWRIHTFVKLVLGDSPEKGEFWEMNDAPQDLRNTFLPAGQAHEFRYAQNGFEYTEARNIVINAGKKFLFMVIEIHYRDFRRVSHSRVFKAIWYPHGPMPHFHDYDASSRDCPICKKKGYNRKPN